MGETKLRLSYSLPRNNCLEISVLFLVEEDEAEILEQLWDVAKQTLVQERLIPVPDYLSPRSVVEPYPSQLT